MWIFVEFDLPTETKKNKKDYTKFRKHLLEDGFTMFQYSIYIRHCPSKENKDVHLSRIKKTIPKDGNVVIFSLTDKQFEMMEVFNGKKRINTPKPFEQIELF